MYKKTIILLSICGILTTALSLSSYVRAGNENITETKSTYVVNTNGQTYGSTASYTLILCNQDLILAEAIDGTRGYVYESDLNADRASSPEELVALAEKNKKIWEAAPVGQVVVSRYIPVYEADGKTVIGEFPITIGFKKDATDEYPGSLCLN